jgi:hypothetical protein
MAVLKKSLKDNKEKLIKDQPLDISKLIAGVESKPIIPVEEKPLMAVKSDCAAQTTQRYNIPVEERLKKI